MVPEKFAEATLEVYVALVLYVTGDPCKSLFLIMDNRTVKKSEVRKKLV